MTGRSEWPSILPKTIKILSPVTAEKMLMDSVYEARISPSNSASEAFDIAWREARDATVLDMETRFWVIADREGLTGLPSDMWAAIEQLVADRNERQRAERNRDMWKGQVERQSEKLTAMSIALHDTIASPMGVVPVSAEPFYRTLCTK